MTPLGTVTVWLDIPEAVQVLLESSSGAISVDGMDTDGATALVMCKSAHTSSDHLVVLHAQMLARAHDCGRTEVVQQLTSGARCGMCLS